MGKRFVPAEHLKATTGGSCHKYNFVAIKVFHDEHVFVMTNRCLSWQNMSFVMTKSMLMFVTTKYFCCNQHLTKALSQQAYFCCDKKRVLLQQTRVCHNKTFVTTKIILVAAPANNTKQQLVSWFCSHYSSRCQCHPHHPKLLRSINGGASAVSEQLDFSHFGSLTCHQDPTMAAFCLWRVYTS